MKHLINKFGEKLLLRLFRSSVVAEFEGISIASLRGDGAEFAQEILDALVFLKSHDPRRFGIVRRTTDFIVERSLPCGRNSGNYIHGIRAISIDYEVPDTGWDCLYRHGFFAGLIIHEATHGRIKDFGIRTTYENRIEIERLCVVEEHRFYRRLKPLREGIADDLIQPFDPSIWDSVWKAGPLTQMLMSIKRSMKNR